jgi:hypothetical protein
VFDLALTDLVLGGALPPAALRAAILHLVDLEAAGAAVGKRLPVVSRNSAASRLVLTVRA